MTQVNREFKELKDFECMANDTGLVAMLFVENSAPYKEGNIYGFEPSKAFELYQMQYGVPIDPNDGQPFATLPPTQAPIDEPLPQVSNAEIPEDWEKYHLLTRIRLAKEIACLRHSDHLTTEAADDIIRNELLKRKMINDYQSNEVQNG